MQVIITKISKKTYLQDLMFKKKLFKMLKQFKKNGQDKIYLIQASLGKQLNLIFLIFSNQKSLKENKKN
jgi:hypothetical protein